MVCLKLILVSENKVKENLLTCTNLQYVDNILRVEIPNKTVQVEKKWKREKKGRKSLSGYVLVRNGHDR